VRVLLSTSKKVLIDCHPERPQEAKDLVSRKPKSPYAKEEILRLRCAPAQNDILVKTYLFALSLAKPLHEITFSERSFHFVEEDLLPFR